VDDCRQLSLWPAASISGFYLDLLAWSTARGHVERALALAHQVRSRHWIRAVSGFLASTYTMQGNLERAEAVLDAILEPDAPAQTLGQRLAWGARAELALAAADPEAALRIVDHLETSIPYASEHAILRLSHVRSQALAALGRRAEAEAALRAAERIALGQGARSQRCRIHLDLGKLYRSLRRREDAAREFSVAHTIIEELTDNVPDEAIRDSFLRRATMLVPTVPPPTPLQATKRAFDGLTVRQRAVAAMIAQRQTNHAIAEVLCISERTVESHVSNIPSTLGYTTRAQIAGWAVDKGLPGAISD
jgi:DNA-binding CsgD family transcriptional regulator